MAELTERQIKVLKSVIEEYIESAESVGSETLEKKYELGVSPATIRNEMVALTEMKYLRQPHTSSGRIPSKEAFRFYVDQLMEEKKLSVADEVATKEKVWDARFDFDKLMRQATKALAERSRVLAVAATKKGDVYHAGYANILEIPEFYDIDVTRAVLSMLDETNRLLDLFARSFGEESIHMLLGDELGYEFLEPCGMVFVQFDAGPEKSGSLGIIGPARLNYPRIIPMVKYFGNLLEEILKEV